MALRVGVDARALTEPGAGVARYLRGLLRALAGDHALEFVLYSPKPLYDRTFPAHWRVRVIPPPLRGKAPLWFQGILPWIAFRDRIDVFWGPNGILPVAMSYKIPCILTVHDLVHLRFPQTMDTRNYAVSRMFFRVSLQRAARVVTNSRTTADEVLAVYRLSRAKVDVVSPGVADYFQRQNVDAVTAWCVATLGIRPPYLLFVGTLEPRKNLATLLRAVSHLPAEMRSACPLLVCGAPGWKTSNLGAEVVGLVMDGSVRFLGYMPDDSLPWLYSGAVLFLFPSLYEGFGIPVVEAMKCGTVVIAADLPATREVAGDAAMFLPPLAPDLWTQAIISLLHDDRRRAELRVRGEQRARTYSWEKSADRFRSVLHAVGGRRSLHQNIGP